MPDRFQMAEEALLKTLKLHPQLTMPQCHRVSGLEDRTESRRLVDQLVRDGVLVLTDEGGTKFYSRSPELSADDPPPSPPPTPEPPAAPAKVQSPAETTPTVQSPAETTPTVQSPAETSPAAPAIISKHVKTSRYPGVCYDRTTRRWRSFCTVNGKTKNLGSNYPTEEAALRAREAFVQEHHIQSRPLAMDAVPEAQEATAPTEATAPAPAPAEHTITICRLETFSPAEQMMQEMLVYRLRRDGLRSAREAGHSSVTVVYVDEAGDVVSRETVKF